jgi:hypothetical protein
VSAKAGAGGRKNPNLALQAFSCIGNRVRVTKGDAKGAEGVVTGKHGGVEHLMIDFADDVLEQLTYDDKLMVEGIGQGLLDALDLQEDDGVIEVLTPGSPSSGRSHCRSGTAGCWWRSAIGATSSSSRPPSSR